MKNEANYFEIFNESLSETGTTIAELENQKVITKYTFYKFKQYCPSLKNALNIANYLKLSLDYILDNVPDNKFKKYDVTVYADINPETLI